MNEITRPVTDDGLAGFDAQGQFWIKTRDPRDPERIIAKVSTDVRDMICAICKRGWETTRSSDLDDQTKWSLLEAYVHETCLVRYYALNDRALFHRALVGAKLRFEKTKVLPSKYWGDPKLDPWGARSWYSTELLDHPIVVEFGSRKRVYSIEFRAMAVSEMPWWEDAKRMFFEFEVTKDFSAKQILLHAWDDVQARLFIGMVADAGKLRAK